MTFWEKIQNYNLKTWLIKLKNNKINRIKNNLGKSRVAYVGWEIMNDRGKN